MNPIVDLRSDTVTRPTAAMRAAMAAAEVGDDVYGDDPTVNRLQSTLAERFGFPSALFFPTGTQSNLAALMSHCGRGDEYLVGQDAHTYRYEQGGAAVLGSIQPQPLENERGRQHLGRADRARHQARGRPFRADAVVGAREHHGRAGAVARPICGPRPTSRTRAGCARIWTAHGFSMPS